MVDEVGNEFGELVVRAVRIYGLLQSFPADDGGEVEELLAVNLGTDAALEVGCPAFVEPEVLERGVGDEVALNPYIL